MLLHVDWFNHHASGLPDAILCFTLMPICSPCNLNWILMQEIKRDAFREAYVQCSNAIQKMESELRKACHTSDAKVENVLKVRIPRPSFLFSRRIP